MICETIDVRFPGSQDTEGRLTVYIHGNYDGLAIDRRPMVLICPGGGYRYTSDRESEPVAMKYLGAGYHAAILRYSVFPVLFPVSLCELAQSVSAIRENADRWRVDPNAVIVSGFSAGGHLAASLGLYWRDSRLSDLTKLASDSIRPNGLILGYPVITSGVWGHKGSFESLIGEGQKDIMDEMSLERHVNKDVPPVFIWHTEADGSVPVQNSLMFVNALVESGIKTEFHMFPEGGHGLALSSELTHSADPGKKDMVPECKIWIELAIDWVRRGYIS